MSTVLVIKLSSLGDVVLTLHAIRQLKALTSARITWVVDSGIAAVLEGHPDIEEIVRFPREPYLSDFPSISRIAEGLRTVIRRIRAEEYDLAIDFQGRARSYALLQFSRARRKIGRGGFPFLKEPIPHLYRQPRHAVESYLEILEHIGIESTGAPGLVYPVEEEAVARTGRWLESLKIHRPYAVLIPGTSWPSKCWPPEYWSEVADWLEQRGYHVLLAGGSHERPRMERILQGLDCARRISSLAGLIPLRDLGALLAGSAIAIGGDTGPMHLATAAGAKVLALYGPTDPQLTGPWPFKSATVLQAPECRICSKPRCRRKCMRHLEVSRVIQSISEIIGHSTSSLPLGYAHCAGAGRERRE